ncbi:SPOR domain-containing protein [Morganella morganii]
MTHKKSPVLLCLLAGMLISPAAGNGSPTVPVVSEENSAAALYQLGVMWMNSEGVEQDIAQGRYWIHLAARHGYPLAQYNLGVMYFDGIGGTYSRQCAQWWLNRAAAQDDPEVRHMAGQALQSIVPEMAQLPKVYRPVTARECDRLPEWRRHGHTSAISELPDGGDIDTEKMVLAEVSPVMAPAPEQEEQAVVSPVHEAAAAKTETETAKDTVKETAEPVQTSLEKEVAVLSVSGDGVSEAVAGVVNDGGTEPVAAVGASDTEIGAAEQQAPTENTAETVISTDTRARTDTTSAGEVAESETGKPDAEVTLSAAARENEQSTKVGVGAGAPEVPVAADDGGAPADMTSADAGRGIPAPDAESSRTTRKESTDCQVAGAAALSGPGGKNTEMPADSQPEKPVILKPREIRPAVVPAPVLNLGGSPATAPWKHYTLQLSGGTTPDELYRMARKHKLTNYLVYETERHDQRWFVLVAGEYPTLTAANKALKALPAELRRNGPWVRSLRQVQAELK